MKKIFYFLCVFFLMLPASSDGVLGDDHNKNFYAKGKLAFPVYNNIIGDSDFTRKNARFMIFSTLILGVKPSPNYSLELEGFYRKFDFKRFIAAYGATQEFVLTSYGILLNVAVHPTKIQANSFEPFFGAGAGYGYNKARDIITTTSSVIPGAGSIQGQHTDNFVWQLFVGIDYKCKCEKDFRITADLRWMQFNHIKHRFSDSSVTNPKLSSLVLSLGAKYYF